jgi:hypothetical protein
VLRRVCLAALLCVACERNHGVADQELGGLVVAQDTAPAAIDVDRAAKEPDELGRALMRPFRGEAALGPHGAAVATHTTVTENGAQVSDLADSAQLDCGAKDDAWHGTYTNTADYGRETTWVGGQLYLRPRYQRWHQRAPESPDEPAALRDGFVDALGATWDLLAPGAELTDAGPVQVGARAARKIVVRLAATPRPDPKETLSQRAWRQSRVVQAVDGEVVLDADTGVPMSAKLTGKIGFQRDGRTFVMDLEVTRTTSLGAAAAVATIAAPASDQVVATPERPREVDDRDFLLQGIAPPQKRGSGDAPAAKKP